MEFKNVIQKALNSSKEKENISNPYQNFKNSIFLVDFNYIAVRNLFALYKNNKDPSRDPRVYYNIYLQIFKNMIKGSPISVIICQDHYLNWRKTIDTGYKERRKEFKAQFNINWKLFHKNLDIITKSCTDLFGMNYLCIKGCEADDLVAILSRNLPGKKIILSADQDLTQLIDKNTIQINPFDMKLKSMSSGINSKEEFVKAYAIAGQGKDDIPQIRKFLGIKTALKHLRNEKIIEFTIEEKKRIKLNEILMDLNQIPFPVENFVLKEIRKTELKDFGPREDILDFIEESQFSQKFYTHLEFLENFKKNRIDILKEL